MKPLRLRMSAFGPYASVQELDFSDLQGRSFFLIHGPTGAGKTTILDAICYSLYGDTSGALRDGKSMRSDHAGADVITEVTFDFAIGADCYRVSRRPEQERASKRGSGTVTDPAKATLWQLTANGEEVLASGADKVTRKVEELLGFKSSQFRQVVLLPQGDFRKLLTADSQQRQQIMQTLFKTEFYRQIEEYLKQQALQLEKEQQALANEEAWVLREAAVSSAQELTDRLKRNTAEYQTLTEELTALAAQVQAAEQALADGRLIAAKLAEQQTAAKTLAALEEKIPVVETKRQELTAALKAAGLTDAEQQLRQLAADADALRAKQTEQERELAAARREEAQALLHLQREQSREGERDEALRRYQQLKDMDEKVAQLQAAEQQALVSRNQAEKIAQRQAAAEREAKLVAEKLVKMTAEYEASRQVALQVDSRKAAWEAAEKLVEKRQKLAEGQQQEQRASVALSQVRAKLSKLEHEYETLKTRLAADQAKWAKAQAAVMAAQLQPGMPCPVCGSVHHPCKASGADNVPSEKALKAQQVQLEKIDNERKTCQQQLAAQEADYITWKNRAADLRAELGEAADAAPSELKTAATQAKASYYAAVDAGKQAQTLAAALAELTERQKMLTEELESLAGQMREADSARRAAEAVVAERRQGVPAELAAAGALKAAQTAAFNQVQALKKALEAAQTGLQTASQRVTAIEASLTSLGEQLAALTKRLQAASEAFRERIINAGFADLTAYQAAKKAPDYLKLLEERINKFDQDLAAAKAHYERAAAAADGLAAPDMAALEAALAAAKNKQAEAVARHTTLASQINREREWLARLAEVSAKMAKLSSRYSVIGKLAQVANGKNQYGITLQRFVLGALLDDVAVAANERLKMMSRGRYFLQRTLDRARSNAAGGLQLEVFDNHTGVARPVNTLSGGETFLASLALALGLADVVQSYAGGIHLDTIFIDEGFGTLDPETLEYALQALIELQQGGRLVGIISHVPELKERIDARLEVIATDKGSIAQFKIS